MKKTEIAMRIYLSKILFLSFITLNFFLAPYISAEEESGQVIQGNNLNCSDETEDCENIDSAENINKISLPKIRNLRSANQSINLAESDSSGNVYDGPNAINGGSTTGVQNTAFGYSALFSNASASYNTAFGYNTLYFNQGHDNTAIGIERTLYQCWR